MATFNRGNEMQGRSQQPISLGTPVLIITCPALAHAVLNSWFTPEQMLSDVYPNGFDFFMDGIEMNQNHGVYTGTVTLETVGKNLAGLERLEVDISEILFPTDEYFKAARSRLDRFLEENPWSKRAPRVGAYGDTGSLLLGALADKLSSADDEQPVERPWMRYVQLPDDVFNALKMMDSPNGRLMSLIMMDEEELKVMLEDARSRNDTELVSLLERDDDAAPDDLIELMTRREAERKPKEPLTLVLPDTDSFRAFVRKCRQDTYEGLERFAVEEIKQYAAGCF
jgi:hypothetical protein